MSLNGKLGNRKESEDSCERTEREDAGDRLPFPPSLAKLWILPPVAPVSVLLLESTFLSFSLLFPCPCIGSVASQVVARQGNPCTTISDRTWNLPPPWAGPLHLAEERVVLKVSRRLCLPTALPWEKKERVMCGRRPGDWASPQRRPGWRARPHGIRLRNGFLVTPESTVSPERALQPLRLPEDFGLRSDQQPAGSRCSRG